MDLDLYLRQLEELVNIDSGSKNADGINMEIDVFTPEEELPDVDLIIVTAIYFYAEIERTLKELTDYRVSSLEDILYEM